MSTEVKSNQAVGKKDLPTAPGNDDLPGWLNLIRNQVASLKFGTVQVTVHDSRVIQIERLEKLRLDRPHS